jgi:2'-5' RNA ligase
MDQQTAYLRVWQTFCAIERLADGRHDTAEWRSHAGVFAVCVIRVAADGLQPALDECRASLAAWPGVRLHPDHFLHITLQELGFVCDDPAEVDEISPARLEEFANAAIEPVAEREPFEIAMGGVNSFQDAVFLEVRDDGAAARLHERMFELAALPRISRFAYLPHATIAHYTAAVPAAGLAAHLAPWRDAPFGRFRANEVEIVTLRLDEPYPPLESYAVIPFGG